jgi:peroxiredoxin
VAGGIPYDRLIQTRRRHILWLIEFSPKGRNWLPGNLLIPPRGPLADPDGYDESVRQWKSQIARPGATPEVVANAAIYLKATDRAAARQILDAALQLHPGDGMLCRAVGVVDAAAIAGIDGLAERGQFSTDAHLRGAMEARSARHEIDSSTNAFMLGGAAQMLAAGGIQNLGQLTFGDDDVPSLAERWLRHAIQIAPSADQWKNMLAPILRGQANREEDPRQRARLFSEALTYAPDRDKPQHLAELAKAEFEAGDDSAAQRDAQKAVDAATAVARPNPNQSAEMTNRGHSVLGRIALAHGDEAEARAQLKASLQIPADANNFRFNGPDMSLAQDLAESGERDAVIEYLEAARRLWLYDRGNLDRFIRGVKAGRKREAFANFPPASINLINRPAPAFSLREPGGKEWTLASIAQKPAALIFWNAACQTCAGQISEFAKAASSNVRLFAVNAGDNDAAVAAFVEKNHVEVPVVQANRATVAAYEVETFPSAVFIDAHGRVTQYQVGAAANPRQTLESGIRPRVATPVALAASAGEGGMTVAWQPVPGAQSYVVEWEARGQSGWPSDRDGFLRVVPTRDTEVRVACPGPLRWRVFAVGFGTAGDATAWQTPGKLQ